MKRYRQQKQQQQKQPKRRKIEQQQQSQQQEQSQQQQRQQSQQIEKKRQWQQNQHIQNPFRLGQQKSSFDFQMNYVEMIVEFYHGKSFRSVHDFYAYHMTIFNRYYNRRIHDIRFFTQNANILVSKNINRFEEIVNLLKNKIHSIYKTLKSNSQMIPSLKQQMNLYFKYLFYISIFAFSDEKMKKEKPLEITFSQQKNQLTINDLYSNRFDIDFFKQDHIFFLVNKSGFFSYNNYLYALYHGILLIGIPLGRSSYDDVRDAVPIRFFAHDITHSREITDILLANKVYFQNFQRSYRFIFQSENHFTLAEKEALVFTLWFLVHEEPHIIPISLKKSLPALIERFLKEWKSNEIDYGIHSFFNRHPSFGKKCVRIANILIETYPNAYYLISELKFSTSIMNFALLSVYTLPILMPIFAPSMLEESQSLLRKVQ
jgi:hypothetical protein